MSYRSVDPSGSTTLQTSLLNNDTHTYVHLIKFEKPSVNTEVGYKQGSKPSRKANTYSYLTDGGFPVSFNDGSVPSDGSAANGAQTYIPGKVLSVGTVSETIEAKASTMSLTLAASALSASVTDTFTITSSTVAGTTDLLESGFSVGDTVEFSGSGANNGVYVRIDSFSNENKTFNYTTISGTVTAQSSVNYTLSFASEEIASLTASKEGTDYSNYLNREVFIYRGHINPSTGALIGSPFLIFKGIITGSSFDDKVLNSAKVTWTLTSHWGDFVQVSGRITSDHAHRGLDVSGVPSEDAVIRPEYVGDLGFRHAEQSVNIIATYQTPETRYKLKRKGGLSGLLGGKRLVEYTEMVDRDVDLEFNLGSRYIPVIYGVQKATGIPIFADGDVDNAQKVYVAQAISEGPIHGVLDIHIDSNPVICINGADSTDRASGDASVLCVGRADRGDVLNGGSAISTSNDITQQMLEDAEDLLERGEAQDIQEAIAIVQLMYGFNEQRETHSDGGAGILHEKKINLDSPLDTELQFHAGLDNQAANSFFTVKAGAKKFKVQSILYPDLAPSLYWGPSHQLLDTAYTTMNFTIDQGEFTIPDYEFVVKGRVLDCFNYDYSYSGSGTHVNFKLGDMVTLHRTSDDTQLGSEQVQIIDKWSFYSAAGLLKYRFRFSKNLQLQDVRGDSAGDAKNFYMKTTDGNNNKWHFAAYDGVMDDAQTTPEPISSENFLNLTSITSGISVTSYTASTAYGNQLRYKITGVPVNEDQFRSSGGFVAFDFVYSDGSKETVSLPYESYTGSQIFFPVQQNFYLSQIQGKLANSASYIMYAPEAVRLSSTSSTTDDEYNGLLIEITRIDTSTGDILQKVEKTISDYDGSNKIAFLDGVLTFRTNSTNEFKYTILGDPEVVEVQDLFPAFQDKRVSTNPAIQLLDYLTNKRYGKGLDIDNDIDLPSFLSVARTCDERSRVTVMIQSGTAPTVGDKYRYPATGDLIFQGTVDSVKQVSYNSLTFQEVTFKDVIGKLIYKWSDYRAFKPNEVLYYEGTAFTTNISSAQGQIVDASTRDSFISSNALNDSTNTFTLTKVGSASTTFDIFLDSGDTYGTASTNPAIRRSSSTGFNRTGYSLYDSDDCVYWVYLGWDEPEQRYVTRHQTNLTVDTSQPVFNNINAMLEQFGGMLRYSNGKYTLAIKTGAPADSHFDTDFTAKDISEDDIIGGVKVQDSGSRKTFNALNATIVDPANKFGGRSITFMNSEYLKQDRGIKKQGNYNIPGISNYFNARMNIKQQLDESRYGLTIKFTIDQKGYLLLAGDIIRLTYSRFGWSNKYFRINSLNFQADGLVQVVADEHNNNAYIIDHLESSRGATGLEGGGQGTFAPAVPSAPTSATAPSQDKAGQIELSWTNGTNFNSKIHRTQIARAPEANNVSAPNAALSNVTIIAEVQTNTFLDSDHERTTNSGTGSNEALATKYDYWVRHIYNTTGTTGTSNPLNKATTWLSLGEGHALPTTQTEISDGITIGSGGITMATDPGGEPFIMGGMTDYNTGDGFYLGYDSDKYKFAVGSNTGGEKLVYDGTNLSLEGGKFTVAADNADAPTIESDGSLTADKKGILLDPSGDVVFGDTSTNGNYVFFDESAGTLTIKGEINATSGGTIGGFTINTSPASLTAGTGTNSVHISPEEIFLGSATAATAPFRVTKAGVLTATSGTIGGFTLASNNLSATNISISTANGIQLGPNNEFTVTTAGALTATSATITGQLLAGSTVSGQPTEEIVENIIPSPAQALLSERVVMEDEAIEFAVLENDTRIFKNKELLRPTTNDGTFLSSGTKGQITASEIAPGDILTSNKPVFFRNIGRAAPSLAQVGTQFVTKTSRGTTQDFYIYSPYGTGTVKVIVSSTSNNGGSATDFSFTSTNSSAGQYVTTATEGSVVNLQITQSSEATRYYWIESDVPVVITYRNTSQDERIVRPVTRELLDYDGGTALRWDPTSTKTINEATNSNSGAWRYFYSEILFGSADEGDNAGNDGTTGIPWNHCGDTYIIDHTIRNYQIASLEPSIINVYYWHTGNSEWTFYKRHDFSNASRTNFQQHSEGTDDYQGGSDLVGTTATPWRFVGTGRFALRTNDTAANEYFAQGYLSSIRLEESLTVGNILADQIQVEDLAAINADIGNITAGTLKGGSIPDADAKPENSESGSFFDLTNGKFVVGDATNNLLFNGSDLELTGKVTSTSGTIGNINIGSDGIYSGSHSTFGSTADGFFFGSNGTISVADGTANIFRVNSDGDLTVVGDITANKLTLTAGLRQSGLDSVLINVPAKFNWTSTKSSPEQTLTRTGRDLSFSGNQNTTTWNNAYYVEESKYAGGNTLSFRVNTLTSRYMVGFENETSSDNLSNTFTDLDYAVFVRGNASEANRDYRIYEAGILVQTLTDDVIQGDTWKLQWFGGTLYYLLNGVIKRETTPSAAAKQVNYMFAKVAIDGTGSQHTTLIDNVIVGGGGQYTPDSITQELENTVEITNGGITLSSGGAIKGGLTGFNEDSTTNDGSGKGFFLGYDGSAYKLSIGDEEHEGAGTDDGQRLLWDGTNLSVTGALNATSGAFTGQVSTSNKFIAGDINSTDVAVMDGDNSTYRFYAGALSPSDAAFSVDKDGKIIAQDITIYDQNGQIILDVEGLHGIALAGISAASGAGVEEVSGRLDNNVDEITFTTTSANEQYNFSPKIQIDISSDGESGETPSTSNLFFTESSTSNLTTLIGQVKLIVEYFVKTDGGSYPGSPTDTEEFTFVSGTNATSSQIRVNTTTINSQPSGIIIADTGAIEAIPDANISGARLYVKSSKNLTFATADTYKIKINARIAKTDGTTLTSSTTPKLIEPQFNGNYGVALGTGSDQSSLEDFRRLYTITPASGNTKALIAEAADDSFRTTAGTSLLTTGGTISGDLTVTGNLTVSGTSTTVNTNDLTVADKEITLNYHATNDTSSSANGAGITIQDAVDASTDASILWNNSTTQFDFSHGISVASGQLIRDASQNTNYLKLDDDTNSYGSNGVTLSSVSAMNFILDTNNNDTGSFTFFAHNSSPDNATKIASISETGIINTPAVVSTGGTHNFGQDTPTNVGFVMEEGDALYARVDGNYARNIIRHSGGTASDAIEIGQGSTALISDIKLIPGSSGNILFQTNNDGTNPVTKASITSTGQVRANSLLVENPATIGHIALGSISNDQENNYIRGALLITRDEDQITYDASTNLWTHAGGSSTDWSMVSHSANDEGMSFYVGNALSSATTYNIANFNSNYRHMQIMSNGNIKFFRKIQHTTTNVDNSFTLTSTNNTADSNHTAMLIDLNISGTDTVTTGSDRTKRGLFIDVDSSASGGGTADETRLYGIWSDVRNNAAGTSDDVNGAYLYGRTSHTNAGQVSYLRGSYDLAYANPTTGTVSNMYGTHGYASVAASGDADVNNVYGVYGQGLAIATTSTPLSTVVGVSALAQLHGNNTADLPVLMGVRSEVQFDNHATNVRDVTSAYAYYALFDNNIASENESNFTLDNSYLFYGTYSGTRSATNDFGIYINSDVDNYFAGNIGIGATSPDAPLHIKTTADGNALKLESTDAGAVAGPTILLDRFSASPANGDDIGRVKFTGRNDASSAQVRTYASIDAEIVTKTEDYEEGALHFRVLNNNNNDNGTPTNIMTLRETTVVINDNSSYVDYGADLNIGPSKASDGGFFPIVTLNSSSTGTAGVASKIKTITASAEVTRIESQIDGASNKGKILFYTHNGTALAERVGITNGGNLTIGGTSTIDNTRRFIASTGSITSPSYKFDSSSAGMYSPASGEIAFSTGTYDLLDLTAGSVVIGTALLAGKGINTGSTGTVLKKIIPEVAIEDHGDLDYRHYNVLGGSDKKYTVTVTNGGSSQTVPANIFRGDSSHQQYNVSTASTEVVILIEDIPETEYTAFVGINFGNTSFRARGVKIETFRNNAWQTECDLTNQIANTVARQIASNDGNGVTKVKYTLKDPALTSSMYFRVQNVFLLHYATSRSSHGYDLSRYDDQTAYGNLTFSGTTTLSTTTATADLTIGTGTDSTAIVFPDKNVDDNPDAPADKRQLIKMGDNGQGGMWQTSGRGGLMVASGDDSLVLASGDVGRTFDPNAGGHHPNSDTEEMYLLADSAIRFTTGLQDGFNGGSSFTPRTSIITDSGSFGLDTTAPTNYINTGSYFKPDSNGKFFTMSNSGNTDGSFILLQSGTTTDNDQYGGLYFTATAGQSDAHRQVAGFDAIVDAHSTNTALNGADLRFFTKPVGGGTAVPQMTIRSGGNIGIGTDAPDQKLHVKNGRAKVENIGNATGTYAAEFVGTPTYALPVSGGNYVHNQVSHGVLVKAGGTNVNNTDSYPLRVQTFAGTDILVVEGRNQRVGIGTNDPSSKVHISSGAGTNGDAELIIESDTDNTVESSNALLTLYQDNKLVEGGLRLTGANNDGAVDAIDNSFLIRARQSGTSIGHIQFATGGAAAGESSPADPAVRMTIRQEGEIGIGTNDPANKLHVKSGNSLDGIRVENTNANAFGGVLDFVKTSTSPANGDQLGLLNFRGYNNAATPALHTFADIYALSTNIGDGTEAGELVFRTSTGGASPAVRLRIDENGNVGINENNPDRSLHVAGNSRFTGSSHTFGDSAKTATNIDIIATNTDGAPAATTSINFQGYETRAQGLFFTDVGEANKEWFIGLPYNNGSLAAFQIGYDNDSTNPQPEYAAHSLFRVLNSGYVGIGTTSIDEKLHVQGAVNNDDVAIKIENAWDDDDANSNPTAALRFATASMNAHLRVYGAPADTASKHQIDLGSTASGSFITFTPNSTEIMRLTGTAVGIGTDSPAQKLDVQDGFIRVQSPDVGGVAPPVITIGQMTNAYQAGMLSTVHLSMKTTNSAGNFYWYLNSTTPTMMLKNDGNFGIGTSNPSRRLDVVASGNDGIRIASGNAFIGGGATGGDAQLLYWNGSNAYYGRNSLGGSVSNHYFRTGGTDRLSIDSNGNVGIGTFLTSQPNSNSQTNLSPASRLHIFKSVGNTGTDVLLTLEASLGDYTTEPKKLAIDIKGQDTNNQENFARIAQATVNDSDYGDNNEQTSNLIFGMTQGGTYNERMILTGAGRLGLGTLNPAAPLHITDTGAGADTVRIESTNSGTGQAQAFGPALALVRTQTSEADGDKLGALRFFGQNSSNVSYEYAKIETTSDDVTDGAEDGGLNFYVSSAGSLVEKGSFNSYGLFVNTTSSIDNTAQLQIKGNASGYARITMQDVDNTNAKTFFTQSGGTTQITTQNGSNGGTFKISTWDGSDTFDRVTVDGNGDVGINVAPASSAKLRVGGGIASTNSSISAFGNLVAGGKVEAGSASSTLGYWLGSTQIIDGNGKILSLDAKTHSALEKPVYDGSTSDTGSYIYSADHNYVSNIPDHDNWHDVFSFRRFYTWTYETSTDGSSFSSDTISNVPFDQKDSTSYELLNDTVKAARWTVNGVNYADIKYLGVGVNYTPSTPAVNIKVETSSDGSTWSNLGGSTVSGNEGNNGVTASAISYLLRLGEDGLTGDIPYIRITITKQTISNTNDWDLAYLRAWSNRPGDQGKGKEYMVPYDYHERSYIRLVDNQEFQLGSSGDTVIEHTGLNFAVTNTVGDFFLINQANDKDVVIQSDSGSGGLVDYFRADGSTGNARLYHYGTEKFTTTAKGVQVSGVSSTYTGGTHSFAEFIANVDHRALLKIKNSNTNASASAPRAGIDLDAANYEDSTRLHAILDVRARTSAGNGGDANLTVPYDFSIYTNNKGDLTLNDGDQASTSVPGGVQAFHIDASQNASFNKKLGVGLASANVTNQFEVVTIGNANGTYAAEFTGTPTYQVPVSGGNYIHNQVSNGVLIKAGGTNVNNADSYPLRVQTFAETDILVVEGRNQRVGIGTNSPHDKLHINGGDLGLYGSVSSGVITHRTLHFHASDGAASLSNSNKNTIGEIAFSGHDSSTNADGKYAHIKSYVIDANSNIQGTEGEGGQLEFSILRHDVSTNARVEYTALTIDNNASITFNEAFTFPTTDGSANQVLTTDGSGTVTWADAGGGAIDSITNFANNRVITATDADSLNGEENLTFNGSVLGVPTVAITSTSLPRVYVDNNNYLDFDDDTQRITGGTNATVLSSVSDVAIRTNANDGGGGLFTVATGSDSVGNNATMMMQVTTSGDATFAGSVSAVTKSFDIEHPTKPGMRLHHGSLEGPEHGVYVRGHATENVIELPEYWTGLVDEKTITVQLTANGRFQKLYVEKVENNKVYLRNASWFSNKINCYYMINATRKDIEEFEVEYGNS